MTFCPQLHLQRGMFCFFSLRFVFFACSRASSVLSYQLPVWQDQRSYFSSVLTHTSITHSIQFTCWWVKFLRACVYLLWLWWWSLDLRSNTIHQLPYETNHDKNSKIANAFHFLRSFCLFPNCMHTIIDCWTKRRIGQWRIVMPQPQRIILFIRLLLPSFVHTETDRQSYRWFTFAVISRSSNLYFIEWISLG